MYLFYFNHDTQRKNKLEEEFFTRLSEWNKTLIKDEKALKKFVKELTAHYEELSKKHKRCKPVQKDLWKDGDEYVYSCGYVNCRFIKVDGIFAEEMSVRFTPETKFELER